MALYQLFVARDFDVLHEVIAADHLEHAKAVAARVIADAFRLPSRGFDELVGETDGYYLEEAVCLHGEGCLSC